VSSSSSADGSSLAALVERSFFVLEREHPTVYAALCDLARELVIALELDNESFSLRFATSGATVEPTTGHPDASVRCSRKTIRAVLDGETIVREAILSDEICIVAAPLIIDRLDRVLALYLAGAVRCPGFHDVLVSFHRGSARS
jgi:hypothetical protein